MDLEITFLLYSSRCLFGQLEHKPQKKKNGRKVRVRKDVQSITRKKIHVRTKQARKKKKGGGPGWHWVWGDFGSPKLRNKQSKQMEEKEKADSWGRDSGVKKRG